MLCHLWSPFIGGFSFRASPCFYPYLKNLIHVFQMWLHHRVERKFSRNLCHMSNLFLGAWHFLTLMLHYANRNFSVLSPLSWNPKAIRLIKRVLPLSIFDVGGRATDGNGTSSPTFVSTVWLQFHYSLILTSTIDSFQLFCDNSNLSSLPICICDFHDVAPQVS